MDSGAGLLWAGAVAAAIQRETAATSSPLSQ
jgi:hypothetical protein